MLTVSFFCLYYGDDLDVIPKKKRFYLTLGLFEVLPVVVMYIISEHNCLGTGKLKRHLNLINLLFVTFLVALTINPTKFALMKHFSDYA